MKKILLGFVLGVLLASAPMHADAIDRAGRMLKAQMEDIKCLMDTIIDMNEAGKNDAQVYSAYAKHFPEIMRRYNAIIKISEEKD